MNLGGKFVPMKQYIPTQELYEKVVKAIKEAESDSKKEKTAKRETMSDVSRRYY